MNTIEDLRTTLAAHAGEAGDPVAFRNGSIHARIRKVRTRRRGALVAVAAVVAAVIGAAVLVLPGPEPIEPAGLPRQVSVHGFEYRLANDFQARGTGAGGGETDLPEGQHAVVLTGQGLSDGTATVFVDGVPLARLQGDGTSRAIPVEGDSNSTVSTWVSGTPEGQEHSVTVGIYGRTDAVPEGISGRGVVFRERVGERTLLAGAISEPGAAEATFEFEGQTSNLALPMFCYAKVGGWLHVEIDGRYIGGVECLGKDDYEQVREDAGPGGLAFPDGIGGIGARQHVVRVFTNRDSKSRHAEALPDGLFGAATYRQGELVESIPGLKEEAVFEAYGSTWQVDGSDRIARGTRTYTKRITVGHDPLMASVVLGEGSTSAAMRVEAVETDWDDEGSFRMEPIGAGGGLSWLLLPGDTYEVSVSTADGTFSGALVTYRPVD
jgi:hypothetical protein